MTKYDRKKEDWTLKGNQKIVAGRAFVCVVRCTRVSLDI